MAEETTFALEILTVQKLFLEQDVRFVIAPGEEGVFEILAHHAPYVFALKPGPLQIRQPEGGDEHIAVGSGFLVVQKDRTVILVRSAERADEIDVERATQARDRAQARLDARSADTDLHRAELALKRAVARLKVAEYRKEGR